MDRWILSRRPSFVRSEVRRRGGVVRRQQGSRLGPFVDLPKSTPPLPSRPLSRSRLKISRRFLRTISQIASLRLVEPACIEQAIPRRCGRERGRAKSDRRGQSCNAQASCLLARRTQLFEMLCYSTLTTTTSRSHSATTAFSPPSSSTAATPTSAPAPGPPTRSTICAPVRARVPAAGTGGER